ncbi:MAG TPA: PPC domain-containing protein [Pirellulales bacterium]|nr:PPC domain-containing protein [Pirellulales bacterium]
MKRRFLFLAVLSLFSLGIVSAAQGAVGFRQLTATYPAAVQRGTKATVTVRSNFTLDGAYSVLFDEPGVVMTYAEEKPIEAPLTGRGRPGTPFHFQVDVPANQPSRVYEFRVATPQAVSSVGHLLVTDFRVLEEQKEENGTAATAQTFALPAALCGQCEKSEDVDCYRFSGKAGDEAVFQIYAQRVTTAIHDMVARGGNYLMDPILTLFGPTGQVVAQNDNYFGGDSLLACKLPADGEYVLEVRDSRYIGDFRYTYCVEAANRPLAIATFPLAVERGKSTTAELMGPFCEQLGKVELTAAADAASGWKSTRFNTSRGETNLVEMLVSEYAEILAPADHHSPGAAAALALPTGVSGRLAAQDEAHYYAFDAKQGAYYLFEIESHRRSLPLDAVLEIYDAAGKKLAEADDQQFSKDPQLYFQAPADGRFTVCIRDLHGRGGPAFAYHLRAEPAGPDFELQGEYYYAMLAPGTRMLWFVRLNRLNGFTGPVRIDVEGLPAGVSFTPVAIPEGMTQCSLVLSCAADAPRGASLVHVVGQAEAPGPEGDLRPIVHRGRVTCELQSQGGGQARWPIATQLVGVVDKLDLVKVEAAPKEITLAPGGKAEFSVRIERNEGFTDPVTLDMAFVYFTTKFGEQLPPGVTMGKASKARLTGDVLEGKIVLEAADNAVPVERLPIAALASVSISFSINTMYASNPVYLTVAPASAKPAAAETAAAVEAAAGEGKK